MKRIVVTLYRKREKMKKKSLKAVGTVLAVCLCVQQPVEVQLPQQQRITQ